MDETSNSLLAHVRAGENDVAWQRLVDCYTPFMRSILLARGIEIDDIEDVVQNALAVVVRRIPDFERERTGSFRTWLRAICANCLQEYWRKQKRHAEQGGRGTGDSRVAGLIQDLADPASDLSRMWDDEHDAHVLMHLLETVRSEFQPNTFEAFRRLAVEGESVDAVAADLGISVNAAFIARSRVLKRLREIGAGMIE